MLFIKKYWKTISWMLIIGILSLVNINSKESFDYISHKDKIIHFSMYFWMVYLFLWETGNYPQVLKQFIAVGFGTLYGGLMEVLQSLTGYRSADWWDILANGLGAVTGMLAFGQLHNRLENLRLSWQRNRKDKHLIQNR